jgi:hypothetical protein
VRPVFARKAALVAAIALVSVVVPTRPVEAITVARYTLSTSQPTVSRLSSTNAVPLALTAGAAANAFMLTAFNPVAQGSIRLQPCNAPFGAGETVLALEPGDAISNLVQVSTAGQCLKSNITVDVSIVTTATASASGASGYLTLAAPVVGFSGSATAVASRIDTTGAGLPAGVLGLSLLVDAAGGSISFHECGRAVAPPAIAASGGATTAAFVVLPSAGLCVSSLAGPVDVTVRVNGHFASANPAGGLAHTFVFDLTPQTAPGFVPITPTRLFDTRPSGPRPAGSTYRLDVGSTVPPSARAITMNVTVANPGGSGYVTVFPCADGRPTASNVNMTAGLTVPNLVTVGLGSTRAVCFFTSVASDLIADLAGWYERGGGAGFKPQNPARLFDTRSGSAVGTNATYIFDLGSRVSASTTAIAMNVTAVEPSAGGYITVYPCDSGQPTASNLNFVRGQTIANSVVVKVGASRRICFFSSAATDLLADLSGIYATSEPLGFFDVTPTRLLDSRLGGVALCDRRGQIGCNPGLPDGTVREVAVPGAPSAVTVNATVTHAIGGGFVTAFPCDKPLPTSSNVNFTDGATIANLVTVATSSTGRVCFYVAASDGGSVHLLVDLAGSFNSRSLIDSRPRLI